MIACTNEFLATLVRGDDVICEDVVCTLERNIHETFSGSPAFVQFDVSGLKGGSAYKDELITDLNFEDEYGIRDSFGNYAPIRITSINRRSPDHGQSHSVDARTKIRFDIVGPILSAADILEEKKNQLTSKLLGEPWV